MRDTISVDKIAKATAKEPQKFGTLMFSSMSLCSVIYIINAAIITLLPMNVVFLVALGLSLITGHMPDYHLFLDISLYLVAPIASVFDTYHIQRLKQKMR